MSTQTPTKAPPVHSAIAANRRTQEWVRQNLNAAYPSDAIHASNAEELAQVALDRNHYVDYSDPNWITVIHKTNLTQVKYPRNKPGVPYTITMRARILRAFKLMLFFVGTVGLVARGGR